MLKFAIIGSLTKNTQDLLDSIAKAGHKGTVIKLADITFETQNGNFLALHEGKDVIDFDVVIFRGYDLHQVEAQLLAELLVEKNKTILEQTLAGYYISNKTQQAKRLFQAGIKHPQTFQASNLVGWKNILEKISFPIIAKPNLGCKGRGIQKLNTFEEAKKFFQTIPGDYLVQQYFPIKSDFRIFVVGGEVVGGFERFLNEGAIKTNIRGTRGEMVAVSEKMKEIAINSTKAMGYEIAGVDLFEHEGEVYVIEVNVTPQWERFKIVTGINPAEHIIKYAIKKHLKK
jgi:RimK family alpha-L-glutamate ligase